VVMKQSGTSCPDISVISVIKEGLAFRAKH
jgi:hypothetical protein